MWTHISINILFTLPSSQRAWKLLWHQLIIVTADHATRTSTGISPSNPPPQHKTNPSPFEQTNKAHESSQTIHPQGNRHSSLVKSQEFKSSPFIHSYLFEAFLPSTHTPKSHPRVFLPTTSPLLSSKQPTPCNQSRNLMPPLSFSLKALRPSRRTHH